MEAKENVLTGHHARQPALTKIIDGIYNTPRDQVFDLKANRVQSLYYRMPVISSRVRKEVLGEIWV